MRPRSYTLPILYVANISIEDRQCTERCNLILIWFRHHIIYTMRHKIRTWFYCALISCYTTHSGHMIIPVSQLCYFHHDTLILSPLWSRGEHGTCFWRMAQCTLYVTSQWRHNEHDGVLNHLPHDCLLKRLFRRRSNKTSKLRITGLCEGIHRWPVNSPHKGPVTRIFFPIWRRLMI